MNWHLMRGETDLGTLTLHDIDQPFCYCHFVPAAAFEHVRPLFDVELNILEPKDAGEQSGSDFDPDAWEAASQAVVALGLRLIPGVGEPIDDFCYISMVPRHGSAPEMRAGEARISRASHLDGETSAGL